MRALYMLAVVFFLADFSACSRSARLTRNHEDVASYRCEYIRNNPDGKYNKQITNSEVTKGMNVFEVIASWGLPHLRRGTKLSQTESWIYYTVDDHTQQVMSYELVFVTDSLSKWFVDSDAQGLGILTPRDLLGTPGAESAAAHDARDVQAKDAGNLKKK